MIADAIYVGDSSVERVMLGDVEVWSAAPPGLPVVTITGTTSTAARDQFRAACVEYGTTYQTVTELPFLLDTGRATRMTSMFYGCSALTHVPDMDTVNVTDMDSMFRDCSSLTHVPDMDTGRATRMVSMFRDCTSLTDGNVRCIGRHPDVSTSFMISGSGLTREPFYDTAGNPI